MNLKDFNNAIKNKQDIFVAFVDRKTIDNLLLYFYSIGGSFPNRITMNGFEAWEYFYHYSPKTAKPILHFYFNNIINKYEVQLTYKSIIYSYPQYKKIKINYYFG